MKASIRDSKVAEGLLPVPPEKCSYKLTEVRVPMPDGIQLAADLYHPSISKPHGLILVVGCYGRGPTGGQQVSFFASQGYTVLFTSSRGTFGSGGKFVPGMSEQADFQSIVTWVREQPWYPGKFATLGASYLGYTQWALLHDPPPDLAASVVLCGPHDQARHAWTNGAYRMDRIMWSYMVAHQEDSKDDKSSAQRLQEATVTMRSLQQSLPLIDAAQKTFGEDNSYVTKFMATPDLDDPYWAPVRHGVALERVTTPILLSSGWYDTFPYQSFEQYKRLSARGCTVGLIVGPWTHVPACGMAVIPEALDFLDEHLAGRKQNARPLPVKVFVTGAEEWRHLSAWPPLTNPHEYYLNGDKGLSPEKPTDNTPLSFIYDPNDSTPTMGGPLMVNGGQVHDSVYASRDDVLVYTSQKLQDDVEVMGQPIVQLRHATDIPYADLFVRMSEVDTEGTSHNVVETYQELETTRQSDSIELRLQDCAHVFKAGTRIRLIIAGGSFPLMARNPGVKGNRTMTTELDPVKHTIRHSNGASRLVLPCSTT